jgi:hypothetical protein
MMGADVVFHQVVPTFEHLHLTCAGDLLTHRCLFVPSHSLGCIGHFVSWKWTWPKGAWVGKVKSTLVITCALGARARTQPKFLVFHYTKNTISGC